MSEPMYDFDCPHCFLDVVGYHWNKTPEEEMAELFGNKKRIEFECFKCKKKIIGEYDESSNWYTLRKQGDGAHNYVEME